MTTISCPCKQCGAPVDVFPVWAKLTEELGVLCPVCSFEDNAAQEKQRLADNLLRAWLRLCPPRFIDTTREKLPCPAMSDKAMEWTHGCGHGLNLWGRPNTGKTRTLFLVLKREHFAGRRCLFFGPGEFSEQAERHDWKRGEWLSRIARADLVAFDDVDKYKMVKTHEECFFAVLDKRMRNKRPCLFTGNSDGNALKLQFRQGDAMVRRIREFCTSIHF